MFHVNDEVIYRGNNDNNFYVPNGARGFIRSSGGGYYIVSFEKYGDLACTKDHISLDLPIQVGDRVKVVGPIQGISPEHCLGLIGEVIAPITENLTTVSLLLLGNASSTRLRVRLSSLDKINDDVKGSRWWI